jgi:regulatory helix-turn-helix LysR family protein
MEISELRTATSPHRCELSRPWHLRAWHDTRLDTLFLWWDSSSMMDLNDLRVFEKVASLRNFSAAGRALGLPKSSVSRSVARLETELGTRLLQRTTRDVVLTEAGMMLRARCVDILGSIGDAVDLVGGFASAPRGLLTVRAGVGFGVHVLGLMLPQFLARYPGIEVSLRLGSRSFGPSSRGHRCRDPHGAVIRLAAHFQPSGDYGALSMCRAGISGTEGHATHDRGASGSR